MTHPMTIKKELENNYGVFPPLGIAYIAAVLEKDDYNIKIIDCLGEGFNRRLYKKGKVRIGLSEEDILDRVEEFSPDVVGISNNFTSFSRDALDLARLIKDKYPKVVIVIGGAHATMSYSEIISMPYVDVVVRGEGEYVMKEFMESLLSGDSLGKINSIVWKREGGSIMVNDLAEPINGLDALPFPAWHLLNMQLYISQRSNNFAYSKRFPIGHIIASRGCMYNCMFCSTSKHFKKFRDRSPDNILNEIEFLIRNYGIKEVHFHDDSFLCSKSLVYELCKGILQKKFHISWQVSQGITVWDIDLEMLRLMQEAGMYRVGLPIESGSKRTLEFIRKPINLEKSISIINECAKLGIYTHGNFIIGFPYETKKEINETVSFINRSKLDFIKLLICQPLAGSDLYEIYLREGLLNSSESESSTYEHTNYNTVFFTAEELNWMRDNIMRRFFVNKIRDILSLKGFKMFIYPKINSLDKFIYFTKLIFVSLRRLLRKKEILGV